MQGYSPAGVWGVPKISLVSSMLVEATVQPTDYVQANLGQKTD
jgi:hypothetical protein